MYRQGDVLLRKVSKIKGGKVYSEVKDKILARGEVTGHNHRIEGAKARVLRSASGQLLVELEEPAKLVHEEHGTIELEAGNYEVIRQREYDPIKERLVSD
ncbi:MAG: hypothetical protein KGN01_06750 [Patescibacteria group bacterium]|nr:hypothetical protein [Patescibacteria group bacterium]